MDSAPAMVTIEDRLSRGLPGVPADPQHRAAAINKRCQRGAGRSPQQRRCQSLSLFPADASGDARHQGGSRFRITAHVQDLDQPRRRRRACTDGRAIDSKPCLVAQRRSDGRALAASLSPLG